MDASKWDLADTRIWDKCEQIWTPGWYSTSEALGTVTQWNTGRGYPRYQAERFDENTGEEIVCSTQS